MAALKRAYAVLQIKSIDEEQRLITGIATTPAVDRMGDIVEPKGAEFELPIPLLWQHDATQPVGTVFAAKVTKDGIEVQARFAKIDEPGALKDRIDEAWQSVKAKLVRGLSIGFKELESARIADTYAYRFTKWLWLELSCVTIPANAEATIQTVKHYGQARPAIGARPAVSMIPSGDSDNQKRKSTMKKTYAEQISGWEATRKAKTDRMDDILSKAAETGVTLDEAEQVEHDALEVEVKSIDSQLVRLRAAEEREKKSAKPVSGNDPVEGSRGRTVSVSVETRLPKGVEFARYAMCMANSRGIPGEAMRLAKEHYRDNPGVLALVEKSAVAGGSTSGSHWLDDMVPYQVMNDFIEYLRPGSILGKFGGPNPGGGNYPALRMVGFNERVSGMSTGFAAGWKGEGLPALPSAAVTFNQSLTWNCMSALAVLTKEAIRFSNPRAEIQVRDDLARAVNQKLDNDFIDPSKAASTTTSPASITNGVVATAPSGTGATNVRHDIAALLGLFATANMVGSDLTLIMSATMAAQISMMVNALGQRDFPDLTLMGGSLSGIPVIVSELLTSLGSPATQMIVMVKAGDVYLADDGVVTVEASDQASIEMQDTSSQSAISGTGASLVSLWQTGAIGLLANREITWKKRRSAAAQYLSPCAYAVPTS